MTRDPLPGSETSTAPPRPDADRIVFELLKKELEEIHNYRRTQFQILVGWFTFFCTIVVGAAAWGAAASLDAHHKLTSPMPSLIVTCFYTVQTVLGAITCVFARRDIREAEHRVAAIQAHLFQGAKEGSLLPRSPIPPSMERSIRLMIVTLLSMLPFMWWLFFLITCVPSS